MGEPGDELLDARAGQHRMVQREEREQPELIATLRGAVVVSPPGTASTIP